MRNILNNCDERIALNGPDFVEYISNDERNHLGDHNIQNIRHGSCVSDWPYPKASSGGIARVMRKKGTSDHSTP